MIFNEQWWAFVTQAFFFSQTVNLDYSWLALGWTQGAHNHPCVYKLKLMVWNLTWRLTDDIRKYVCKNLISECLFLILAYLGGQHGLEKKVLVLTFFVIFFMLLNTWGGYFPYKKI